LVTGEIGQQGENGTYDVTIYVDGSAATQLTVETAAQTGNRKYGTVDPSYGVTAGGQVEIEITNDGSDMGSYTGFPADGGLYMVFMFYPEG
jgi:hypothetical protein